MNNYSARSIRAFLDNFPSGAWLIFAVDLLHTIGFSIAFPFLALYLHDTRKLPMSVVGTLFLVAGLCTAGTNLVGGMLSDRLGRRRLFISVTSIGVVAYGGLALLIGVDAPLAVIFAVYIAARSILGTINPTMLAIIADITPRNRLAEIYAFVRTGGNVCFALGPAIGGYMLTFLPFAWLLSISAFACAAVAILCFFLLKESRVRGGEVVDIRSTLAVASDRP